MSPFILMAFVAIGAGLLVPVLAIASAKLGLCEPFSLTVAGKRWLFARHVRVASANSVVQMHTSTIGGQQHRGKGSGTVTIQYLTI